MPLNKNIKIIINYVAGPLLFIFLFYIIYRQIHNQPHWKVSLQQIRSSVSGRDQWKWWLVILLMPVNWGLETLKWKLSMLELQRFSFLQAFKAVLAGTTVASFTPNRVGEYLGRMLYVKEGKKLQSITPTIVCSMAQMLITLLTGTAGLYLYSLAVHDSPIARWWRLLLLVTAGSAGILAGVYFRFGPVIKWISSISLRFFRIQIPEVYAKNILWRVLLLSLLRYMVFLAQYYLLFSLFDVGLTLVQTFAGISVMFVFMAIVPTLTFLTDLGVRWEAGIQVLERFSSNTTGIFAVTLGVWLINLIIPSLIGSLLILRLKLFNNK